MQERIKIHVGLDVHKDSISVAAAEAGRAPGRLIGKVTHDVNKLVKVLARAAVACHRGGTVYGTLQGSFSVRSSPRCCTTSRLICCGSRSWRSSAVPPPGLMA